jgi:hypothetical protein
MEADNKYFLKQVVFSLSGDIDDLEAEREEALKRLYPKDSMVTVTRGNGSWKGQIVSHCRDAFVYVRHYKSRKNHRIFWKDIKEPTQ